jgi:hypothetical protein
VLPVEIQHFSLTIAVAAVGQQVLTIHLVPAAKQHPCLTFITWFTAVIALMGSLEQVKSEFEASQQVFVGVSFALQQTPLTTAFEPTGQHLVFSTHRGVRPLQHPF